MSAKKGKAADNEASAGLDERLTKQESDMAGVNASLADLKQLLLDMQVNNSRPAAPVKEEKHIKFEPSASTPHGMDDKLTLGDLDNNLLLNSVMGKTATRATAPKVSHASKFIDLTGGDTDNDISTKLGKVAKDWGKDLKTLSNAYTTKTKYKEASSYAEWARYMLKRIIKLQDVIAIRRYNHLLLVVNRINHAKGWDHAHAYALVWMKRDQEAAKVADEDVDKARKLLPPMEIDSEILMLAEIKMEKLVAKHKKKDAKDPKKASKSSASCFACGKVGHWANTCTVPCAACGMKGHNAGNCFRAQFTNTSQPAQGAIMGGPVLQPASAPTTAPVCGKCGRMGHTTAQCRSK